MLLSPSSPDESGNTPVLYYIIKGAHVQKRTLLSKADEPRKWKEHMQPFSQQHGTIPEKFSFFLEGILQCEN